LFVVDTNVLIYAAETSFSEHGRCRSRLEEWRRGAEVWYATWSIFYEFVRITTHSRIFAHPWVVRDAWRFVTALLSSPSLTLLTPTDRHREVAARTFEELPDLRGNLIHDSHTAVLMREHGIRRIYTRDTDFHRFPFLEVLDPLN